MDTNKGCRAAWGQIPELLDVCADGRDPAIFSAGVSLYCNFQLTGRCQIASRHAGITDVSPAEPLSSLYSHGVPEMMYGDAKGKGSVA